MDARKIQGWKYNGGETMTTIEQIEKTAKDNNQSALYLAIIKTAYALEQLRNRETGNKLSDVACIAAAWDRVARAWDLPNRMPANKATPDILLVQMLKDEIAISQVAKIVG